jgi:hypothetical protein
MALRFNISVQMVNTYLKYVDAQEARAGAEGINGTTGYGYSNARGGVMAH